MLALALPLLMGVVAASIEETVQIANQSGFSAPNGQPIASGARKGQLDTPEVVLSVKYDGGSIDGIYLAQYRKGKMVSRPAVPEGRELCLDLCHAGLGGDGCGSSCHSLIPVGLLDLTKSSSESPDSSDDQSADHTDSGMENTARYGQPRMGVCPTLCRNNLGYPLCGCAVEMIGSTVPSWTDVCNTFCSTDGYTLRGCPTCQMSAISPTRAGIATRILNTAEGWTAWCQVQCRQGQGGAACNCDLAPFSGLAA